MKLRKREREATKTIQNDPVQSSPVPRQPGDIITLSSALYSFRTFQPAVKYDDGMPGKASKQNRKKKKKK